PRPRFHRPYFDRERRRSSSPPTAAAPAGAATPPIGSWGLPEWLENWLHCRRSLGSLCFGFGVLAYCIGVWKPIEDWLAYMVPPRHGELNTETLKFIVGPTIVVIMSAAFTAGRQPAETFNTAQINGINTACGAFVGQHLLEEGQRASNMMIGALSTAPALLSFLSAFFDYNHAYVSPLVIGSILGGACVPAWSLVLNIAEIDWMDGMAVIDLSLFTMAAAMAECYLRKLAVRLLGPNSCLIPLGSQMVVDLAFSWIADSHIIELASTSVEGAVQTRSTHPADTARQIIRYANVIAVLILAAQTIVWTQEMWNEGRSYYAAAGIVSLLVSLLYVNELGPMPLVYVQTDVRVPPRIEP
ncbi:hypothetical protein PFISCL1PPCAC_18366, partial [Pristionchus fissidentatus]